MTEAVKRRVLMLVWNEVHWDARVQSAARDLRDSEYDVLVIGVDRGRASTTTSDASTRFDFALIEYSDMVKASSVVLRGLLRAREQLKLLVIAVAALGALWILISAWNMGEGTYILVGGIILIIILLLLRLKVATRIGRFTHRTLWWAAARSGARRLLFVATQDFKPDVIHCHDLSWLPSAIAVGRKRKLPIVWDAHEIYEGTAAMTRLRRVLNRIRVSRLAPHVDGFITINPSIAEYYANRYPKLPKATVVGNSRRPSEPVEYDGRLHKEARLPESQRILLYHGILGHGRWLDGLIGVSQELDPHWSLVVMGWGSKTGSVKAQISEVPHHLSGIPRAVFLEPVAWDSLISWCKGASLGAILYEPTSLNYSMCSPNKLWEFAEAQVPILGFDSAELRRVTEEFGLGWTLPFPTGPTQVANFIAGLSDADLRSARFGCSRFIESEGWDGHRRARNAVFSRVCQDNQV